MLPPKCPRSPRSVINNDNTNQNSSDNQIPYPGQQTPRRISNLSRQKQKNRYSVVSGSLQSKSKISKYEYLKTPQQKRKALGKRRYINQLAYLDYEDKHIEIHTKYTKASKISAMKKIKAKNQMAQFADEQEQQQIGFEQLMDYKYGKQTADDDFHFQKEQLARQFSFCTECDSIHNDHAQVHAKICKDKVSCDDEYDKRNQFYVYLTLKRMQSAVKRTSGQEYDSLKQLIKILIQIQQNNNPSLPNNNRSSQNSRLRSRYDDLEETLKHLYELLKVNQNDMILSKIIQKILKELYKRNIK